MRRTASNPPQIVRFNLLFLNVFTAVPVQFLCGMHWRSATVSPATKKPDNEKGRHLAAPAFLRFAWRGIYSRYFIGSTGEAFLRTSKCRRGVFATPVMPELAIT